MICTLIYEYLGILQLIYSKTLLFILLYYLKKDTMLVLEVKSKHLTQFKAREFESI